MTKTCKEDMQKIYLDLAEAWELTIVNNTKMRALLKRNKPELLATDTGKKFYFAMKDAIQQNDAYVGMTEELMDEAASALTELYSG